MENIMSCGRHRLSTISECPKKSYTSINENLLQDIYWAIR